MAEHVHDALLRYDFARSNLAAIDQQIQAAQLKSHVSAAARLSADQQRQVAGLLEDQAEMSDSFATAARSLADALDGDGR